MQTPLVAGYRSGYIKHIVSNVDDEEKQQSQTSDEQSNDHENEDNNKSEASPNHLDDDLMHQTLDHFIPNNASNLSPITEHSKTSISINIVKRRQKPRPRRNYKRPVL